MIRVLFVLLACGSAVICQTRSAPFKPAPVASAPALVSKVEADYTAEARSRRVEGVAVLSAEIGVNGVPSNIRVVKSLDAGLDAQAMQALAHWRFRPGVKDGRAVVMTATIDFHFRLSKFPLLRDPSDVPEEEPYEDNDPIFIW